MRPDDFQTCESSDRSSGRHHCFTDGAHKHLSSQTSLDFSASIPFPSPKKNKPCSSISVNVTFIHPVTHDENLEFVPDFSSSYGQLVDQQVPQTVLPKYVPMHSFCHFTTVTAFDSANVIPTQTTAAAPGLRGCLSVALHPLAADRCSLALRSRGTLLPSAPQG